MADEQAQPQSSFGQILQSGGQETQAATEAPASQAQSSFGRFLENPVVSTLDSELKRGSNWDQASERLKSLGANPDEFADKKKYFDLQSKRKELESRGLSFSQSYRGSGGYQPFGSLVTIPESILRPADYVSREIGRLGGKEQAIGGRVVGNSEYQQATQRFQEGKATDDDIEAIATYEAHAKIRGEISKGANFGQKFALELGSLGTLGAETMTGTGVASAATRGGTAALRAAGIISKAEPAAAALAGVAPAVPTAAAGFGTKALNLGVATAVTPSMYVPMMQAANMRADRDANDVRGLPTSFGYAYANMLVLGQLSGGRALESTIVGNAFKKGILGVAEMQSVDAAAGVVDQFLPKAYQIKPDEERFGNVGMWLRAYRVGDKEKQSEILRDTTVQALAFSAFAAVHGRETHANDLMQSYADTIGSLRSKGMTKDRAAEVVGEMHVKLEDALSAEPYLSREQAREALGKDLPAELKPYADKLVEAFEPKSKLPTPAEVEQASPKSPEPKVAAAASSEAAKVAEAPKPGDVVQADTRKPADQSKVVSTDPTDPNPNRQVTVEHSDGTVEKMSPENLSVLDPAGISSPFPEAPTVLGTGTKQAAWERAADLDRHASDLDAKIVEADAAAKIAERIAKAGGDTAKAKELRREYRNLVIEQKKVIKDLKVAQAKSDFEARQPKKTAATDSNAPSVTPEAPKIQPPVTPTEPTNPAAVATAAPAATIPQSTIPSRQQRIRDLASAATKSPEVRTDLKSRFRELVAKHSLPDSYKNEHAVRFEKMIDKLPDAAVHAINENLTGVNPHKSIYDVSGESVRLNLEAARRAGNAEKIAEFEKEERDWQAGELFVPGFVTRDGVLHVDGHDQAGAADRGRYGLPSVVRAEPVLAHESGHLVDGNMRRVHSSSPEWQSIHGKEMTVDVGGEPALSEYAKSMPSESFAEFFRLVHESDVGHSEIAREFPDASAFFKAKGLWPEVERASKENAKLPEVFNERIESPDGSHADAIRKEEPAAAVTPEPKAKKPRIGERKKSAVEPESASDWQKVDAGDTLADDRVLGQFIEKYKGDPKLKDYLESARHNLPEEQWNKHPKQRREATIVALDASLKEAERSKDENSVAVLKQVIEHFGGKFTAEAGKVVPFNPVEHESSSSISAGQPVEVKRSGVQLWNDGKWNRSYLSDVARGSWYTPVKAIVKPAKAAPKEEKTPQENYDALTDAQKLDIYNDKAIRSRYKKAGVVLKDFTRREVAAAATSSESEPISRLADLSDEVDSNDSLSNSERISLLGKLRGMTYSAIGAKLGVSHTRVQALAAKALEKMKGHSTGWEDFENLSALEEHIQSQKKSEAEAAKASYGSATRDRMEKEANQGKASNLEPDEPGGIQELRIPQLAAVLDAAKIGGRSVWQRLSSLLFGDLPSSIRAAKEQEIDGQIAAYAFDVKNAVDDFNSALRANGKPYEKLTKAELDHFDEINRNPADTPEGQRLRQGVDPKILAALETMRSQIDKLSTKLQDVGAVDGDMSLAFDANKGIYIHRQYAVFTDPLHGEKLQRADPAVVNRFKSWLTNDLITRGESATPEEVNAITLSLLRDGTAAENPIAFLKKSLLGSKDLSILKARKEIPEELRALWGEFKDPMVNYSNSVAKMAHLLTSHNFLNRVSAERLGKFFFDKPTTNPDGEHVHSISVEGNPALSPLAGKYMTKELKAAFQQQFAKDQTGWGMQWYMKALAAAKFNKTILSHVGQLHNFMSNVLVAVRNGHFLVGNAPAAVAAIVKNTEAARDYWRRLTTLGVVGEGLHYNDFQRTMRDALGGREHFGGIDTGTSRVANSMLGRMLRSATGKAAALYNYGDAIWKVYGFENEKAKYKAAGLSESQAEAKAAEIVRDTMPTYSKIPQGLQALRRSPIIAPFVAFQAEMVRTTKNNLLLAIKEMKDPATRSIGAHRLAGMAAAATLPMALTAATRAMFGVDDSEEKALRRFLPDWQKNSRLVYFGRDPQTGHPKYSDLSKIDPHAYLTDGLIAFMQGKNSTDGIKRAADEWAKPFTQEELLLRPAIDIARNQKEPGGNVYNPQASTQDQTMDIAGHIGQQFTPAGYGPVRRLGKSLIGSAEQRSGKVYNTGDELAEQGGVRIETPRVREDLAYKARGFEEAKKQADKMVQDMIHAKGDVSPQELKSARDATEEARKRTMDEFRQDVEAAERLGVPRREIAAILSHSGLSSIEIGQLFTPGAQVPYLPAFQGSATERVRAGEVRKLAAPSGQP